MAGTSCAPGPAESRAPRFSDLDEAGRRELWAALALRHTERLGPRVLGRLLNAFGGAYAALKEAEKPGAWKAAQLGQDIADRVARGSWREVARSEWDALREADCGFLLWTDETYPEMLRRLADPPVFLYCLGDISLLRAPAVAVVGSRHCTSQGLAAARSVSYGLSRHGVTVLSGMAKGIDRAAHLAALQGIGSSIAILGAGIDVRYPPESADAREGLESRGLILSEYGPGVPPKPAFFPIRNRLISALSLAVVVVEAAARSGSLITARLALEQGRDVYAVPGAAMEPASFGCHDLVRQGAKPVFSAEDIMVNLATELSAYALPEQPQPPEEECPWEQEQGKTDIAPRRQKEKEGNDRKKAAPSVQALPLPESMKHNAAAIADFLRREPGAHVDEISRHCGLDAAEVSRCAVYMEMAGLIYQLPGLRYKAV